MKPDKEIVIDGQQINSPLIIQRADMGERERELKELRREIGKMIRDIRIDIAVSGSWFAAKSFHTGRYIMAKDINRLIRKRLEELRD